MQTVCAFCYQHTEKAGKTNGFIVFLQTSYSAIRSQPIKRDLMTQVVGRETLTEIYNFPGGWEHALHLSLVLKRDGDAVGSSFCIRFYVNY